MAINPTGRRLILWDIDHTRIARGLLSLARAGRFLRIARQTFHRWARGYERGQPLLHVRDTSQDGFPVTFVSLTEAHVLDGLREAGVQPHKIRPALDALKHQFGHDYADTVADEFGIVTDGVRTAARIHLGRAA